MESLNPSVLDIHRWRKHHDWKRNEDGSIDDAAWDCDIHNGPMCEFCGLNFCIFCDPHQLENIEDLDVIEPCEIRGTYCAACNSRVFESYNYCSKCGAKLDFSNVKYIDEEVTSDSDITNDNKEA